MIQFSDMSRKVESLDAPSFQIKYDVIKLKSKITEAEAHNWGDEVFLKLMEVWEITEADLQRNVYGMSEEEFEFDFDVTNSDIQ